jgi:hypothetical protein
MPRDSELVWLDCFNSDQELIAFRAGVTFDDAMERAAALPDCVLVTLEDDWEFIPVLHKVLSI